MNFIPVITHAVAILIGWLMVSFARLPEPVAPPGNHARPDPLTGHFRSGDSPPHPSPGSLLAAQAALPMEPAARTALKRQILRDWATTDPDGLLRYLKHRPWLADPGSAATTALAILARTRPGDLLEYAHREGCGVTIHILGEEGDPRLVLDLYLALPGDTISPGSVARVFKRGCRSDPTFHERLGAVGNPATRLAVFREITRTLLDDKREDEFFPWLGRNMHLVAPADAAALVARQLVDSRSDVANLAHLPDTVRPLAVGSTLRALIDGAIHGDEHYQRACLATFHENGWLTGNVDSAANVITRYYDGVPNGMGDDDAIAWKEWALELPANPKWDPLRRTAIRRWVLETPESWRKIAGLPTADLRDAAFTAVMHNLDLNRDGERVPWILHQITDPALRNVALEVITARMAGDPGDPFAAADFDPFRPLGDR
jgi:hypothetical protein